MTFLPCIFPFHQSQCANIEEELTRQTRSSALTNEKLQKEFKDAFSATKALEAKVGVLINLDNI